MVKNLPTDAGDPREAGSIPGSGRSSRLENGNLLQYSCLENSMDIGDWWATVYGVSESRTWLSTYSFFKCNLPNSKQGGYEGRQHLMQRFWALWANTIVLTSKILISYPEVHISLGIIILFRTDTGHAASQGGERSPSRSIPWQCVPRKFS